LPRWEQLVDEDLERFVGVTDLPTSWLFCAENSCDPHHLEHLHMRYMNLVRRRQGLEPVEVRKHAKIDFELFDYGILKKRLWEGDSEDQEEWRVGHPLIFPATLFVPYGPTWVRFQFRVPVDEGRTMLYWYDARVPSPDYVKDGTVPVSENPFRDKAGKFILDRVNPQDMIMWVTQGPVPNHTAENLGESDRGVALFRRTLHEQMDRVERGEDPIGVIRDPAQNTPYVRLPIERHIGYSLGGASPSVNVEYPENGVGRRK
jgi:5,5'-dehydrodivanillate O-demethylase